MLDLKPSILIIALLAGFIAIAGGWAVTKAWLDARAERDALVVELQETREQFSETLSEIAAERAAAELRQQRVQSAREQVLQSTPEDDAPLAPVLERALRAADEIGGRQ